jgi:hypothetical protein
MKDCTIILQGKINKECFDLWINNHKESNVVVSIWEDENISNFAIPSNWKIVYNDYPQKRFAINGNLDLQILSTLRGLINTKTEFVIKMRADEYWSNIELIYEKIKKNKDKIVSSSMFFRKFGLYDFHCGDKILAGTTQNLNLMFMTAYNLAKEKVLQTKVPEVHLGLGYLIAKNEIVFDEKFIVLFNNKENGPFDISGAKLNMEKALKRITENFQILLNKNQINLEQANNTINHCKNILTYCYGYNELVEYYKHKVDIDVEYLMKKNFEIIDVNNLKPYIATRNFGDAEGRIWYRDNFDNDSEDCISEFK